MRKILFGVIITLVILFTFKYCEEQKEDRITLIENASLIKEEIKINPDLEYYDVQSDFLNPFEAKDYNDINETIRASLIEKFENSELKANAKNRLISELTKFYILTNSLGWTLLYNENQITNLQQFDTLNFKL